MTYDSEWFAPKRYGYGAGRPITWQGWALIIGFLALAIGIDFIFGEKPAVMFAILIPAALIMILIASKTTRGGWRWRWGEEE